MAAEQNPKDWQETICQRMDCFEQRLAENTKTTLEVKQNTSELVTILQSWKGAMVVMEFIGKLAKPIAAVIVFIATLWAAWPRGR